jgi:hypothetical protein
MASIHDHRSQNITRPSPQVMRQAWRPLAITSPLREKMERNHCCLIFAESLPHAELVCAFIKLPLATNARLATIPPRQKRRAVVQPGRTLAWGARGREFESRRPDHGAGPIALRRLI